jgi:hypothetical protein
MIFDICFRFVFVFVIQMECNFKCYIHLSINTTFYDFIDYELKKSDQVVAVLNCSRMSCLLFILCMK